MCNVKHVSILCDQILKVQLLLHLLNEFMKTFALVSPNYLQGAAECDLNANMKREAVSFYLLFSPLCLSVSLQNRQTMKL